MNKKNIVDINNNGYVFVPSYEELIKYFGIDQQRTNNDLNNQIVFSSKASYSMYKSNKYLLGTYCLRNVDNKVNSFYVVVSYLESHGKPIERSSIHKDEPGMYGLDSSNEHNWFEKGIRPAIWISLSNNNNQNSHSTNNFTTQQNNTGKDSNTIAGLPSVQSEYRDDGHFYLNNNMQKSTWVYYVTYYYHVDDAGNIEKSKWIEQRYVGSDGRMYRGRQTPDGKWVGDDGLVVNVSQDLSNSLTIEAAEPDSWYKTQSGLWYYFENDRTTTKKGWFTDARDNQTYYLDPSTGIMAVGWTTINGSEYYFNESHDNVNNWYETGGGFYESYGKKTKAYGSMFRNEKTPDGHQVDGNGKMIN